jgi:hypothetical protein
MLLHRWSLLFIVVATVLHTDLRSAVNILLEGSLACCTMSTGAAYLPVVALTSATEQTLCTSCIHMVTCCLHDPCCRLGHCPTRMKVDCIRHCSSHDSG